MEPAVRGARIEPAIIAARLSQTPKIPGSRTGSGRRKPCRGERNFWMQRREVSRDRRRRFPLSRYCERWISRSSLRSRWFPRPRFPPWVPPRAPICVRCICSRTRLPVRLLWRLRLSVRRLRLRRFLLWRWRLLRGAAARAYPGWLAYPTCPGVRLIIKVERTRWPPAGFSCALRPRIALKHRRQRNVQSLADLEKAPRADAVLSSFVFLNLLE